jgi:hypothetical protein
MRAEDGDGPFHGTFGLFTEDLDPRMVTCERTSGEGLAQLHASISNEIGGVLFFLSAAKKPDLALRHTRCPKFHLIPC